MHKKWSFPLTISSIYVIEYAVSTFIEDIVNGKLHFCAVGAVTTKPG